MTSRSRSLLLFTVLAALVSAAPTRAVAAKPRQGPDVKGLLTLGHSGSWEAYNGSFLSSAPLVVASTGKLALVGTVTWPQNANQPAQYEAQPANQLVWKRPGQKPVEFTFGEMRGDFTDNGKNYLIRPYSVKYRVVIAGELDLQVESSRRKTGAFTSAYTTTLKGTVRLQGQQLTVDLTLNGQAYFESSFGGFENNDRKTFTGKIQGPHLQMTVNESSFFEMVGADRVTVSHNNRRVNTHLVAGGKTYQWKNVFQKQGYKNGNINRPDSDWICEGSVLVNGQAFATYGKTTNLGQMIYQINSPVGVVELGR